MKRPTKVKVNKGPKNLRNRKELAAKAQKFIDDCEQSLIRLLDQKSHEKDCTWLDLEEELQKRFTLLRKTYPDHKGKVAVAIHNVEVALKSISKGKN